MIQLLKKKIVQENRLDAPKYASCLKSNYGENSRNSHDNEDTGKEMSTASKFGPHTQTD